MSDSLQPPWTVARQAPLSMGFSRQEYWSGLAFPSPEALGSSRLRDWTQVSCIAGQFFTIWAFLYQLSHQGSPRILEWVAYPVSSGSSWPRNRTRVSALQVGSLPAELSRKPILLPKLDLKIYFLEDCFLWPPVIVRSAVKHARDTCSSLVALVTIETNLSIWYSLVFPSEV